MIIKYKYSIIFFLLAVLTVFSCKKNRKIDEITEIVKEWTGKEISFPDNVSCYVLGTDTLPYLCDEIFHRDYKILIYVDSAGCVSCRLKLAEWKQLIEEADRLFQGKVGFLFYFQPKTVREIAYLLRQEKFDYPVYIDTNGAINRLNNFPKSFEYQCFLLDGNNKTIVIGSPVTRLSIWELYKAQIAGEKKAEPQLTTTVAVDKTIHNFGTVRNGSANQTDFTITNTGAQPLVILRVSASCDCTNIIWDRQPIKPGQKTTIHVEMKPEGTGFFSKTTAIYCNTDDSPLRLTVTGTTIE